MKGAPKVLHVIDSGGLYGAETVLLNCVARQVRSGGYAAIASLGDLGVGEKPLEQEARRRGLPVVPFRMRRGLNFGGALEVVRYAQREAFDVLHCHGYKANILLGLMPKTLRRLPVIATVHGWTSQQRFSRMTVYQALDRLALRFMDRVALVSESMLALKPVRRLKRVAVVRNGIPFESPAPSASAGPRTVGAMGRLSREKGFDVLIDAFARARSRGLDACLTIMGEGPERDSLQSAIRHHQLEGQVTLPGFCHDVTGFLQSLEVFVLSSSTEGAPMSILEALRARTPIVATRVGGVAELLDQGKAGLLVAADDASALAEALLEACADPASARDRASHGFERAKRLYSDEAMARDYSRLYESVMAPGAPS